jgi:ADP-ribose pyrophosphatase YjhB (NUDIX family)
MVVLVVVIGNFVQRDMIMTETRVQAIVIQDNRVLFGYGKGHHFFIGGGLEEGETPEQGALRELQEEANVNGRILFRISEPASPDSLASVYNVHLTYLVEIQGQVPRLGYDPEEIDSGDQVSLAGIQLIPLERTESFTEIDIQYFRFLLDECTRRGLDYPWCKAMQKLVKEKSRK